MLTSQCPFKFCTTCEQRENDPTEHNQDDSDDDCDRKLHQNAAPQYKRLIAIRAGKKQGGMRNSLKVDPGTVKRLSLSEQALEKARESHGTDLVRYYLCSPGVPFMGVH